MGSNGLDGRGIILLCMLVTLVVATESRELSTHNTQVTKAGRKLVEGKNSEYRSALNNRTERPDPLDKLKKYKGGFDITNKHYWSSLIFTGIYGYSIAVLWLLSGTVYAGFLAIAAACSTRNRKDTKRLPRTRRCWWPMIVGSFLTVLVIVASGVVLAGSSKFHSRANSIKSIIADTEEDASTTIYNVTRAVENMQANSEQHGDIGISTSLNSTTQELNDEVSSIQTKARKYYRLISKGLKILKTTTIVNVSLNIVGLLALIVSGLLMFRCPFHVLLILCWLLTFFFSAYFGLYFFLDGLAGDTCMALNEYRQYPHNSSLSAILPCNDQSSANSALQDTKAGIYDLINQVNTNISALQSSNSFPNLTFICNPFSGPPKYNYQPNNCSENTIKIGDIPQILKEYTCLSSSQETCGAEKFISSGVYNRVTNYTTSLQDLLNAFPAVERLVNCQTVKEAFSEILLAQCKPLKRYAHMTWASMVVLSVVMVLLVVISAILAHQNDKHHSSDGSVKPESVAAVQGQESYIGTDKVISEQQNN